MTVLDPHIRGDTFRYNFTLGNGWVGSDFTGGVKFTLRKRQPASTVLDDSDTGVVDQGSVAGGEIAISGTAGSVVIPASRTKTWLAGTLYFDLQGTISGATPVVHTIDKGTIVIEADITRS